MKSAGRILLAILAGMTVAVVLVVAVEMFSSVVHPDPPDFNGDIPGHVKRYPPWVLAVVVPLWGASATAATWVASRLGNLVAGFAVTLLLAWALVFNVTHLPYFLWFKVAMLSAFPIACFLGIQYGRRGSRGAAG